MSAHDTAITAVARAIRRPRYRLATCSDQELAELAVREYYRALPPRQKPRRRSVGDAAALPGQKLKL
jgi:hypothetical protein